MVDRLLQECFKKIPQNSTTKLTILIYCGRIKTKLISILQSADEQGNPSFQFHVPGSKRRYPCTQTACNGCPEVVPPSAPVFYWLSHLTCTLSPKAEKRMKNVDFDTDKNVQKQANLFSVFRRILILCLGSYFLLSEQNYWTYSQ